MDGSWWRVLTKCGSLQKRMENHFSILEKPINSMKRQKDRTLKDELPRLGECPICYRILVEK